jgi:hypothetical protein
LQAEVKEAKYAVDLTESERDDIMKMYDVDENKTKIISGDPGKGVILHATNGKKSVRYTASQRWVESGACRNRIRERKMLRQKCVTDPSGRTYAAIQEEIGGGPTKGRSSKSCITSMLEDYMRARQKSVPFLEPFYRRPVFRTNRYSAFRGRKSSEDKFVERTIKAFGRDVVILYGNWGQRPNLKNQPPTPGIGFRRKMERSFHVVLVYEKNTSSR